MVHRTIHTEELKNKNQSQNHNILRVASHYRYYILWVTLEAEAGMDCCTLKTEQGQYAN